MAVPSGQSHSLCGEAVIAQGSGVGFGDVLRVGDFRALWFGELCSMVGDQLARVALSLLVFERTDSAALTALTYALTFVPALLGGALLSGLADRFPLRRVMIVTDVVRAVLAALMALPGLALPVMWALVAVLSAAAGPFKAAQLAMLPQILGERFPVGMALRQMTMQVAQLAGFAGGGLLLTAVEPHGALLLNATTFVISAVVIRARVRQRPAAAPGTEPPNINDGSATMPSSTDRRVWPLFALVSLLGLSVVPEGIAAPYAHELGVSALGLGLLMAADPAGSALGAWLAARWRLPASPAAAVALAAVTGLPLVVCGFGPGLVLSIALWAMTGAVSTIYLLQTQTMLVERVPDHRRGGVMGRVATALHASVGIAILGGGVASEAVGPFRAVAAAGLLASLLAIAIGAGWLVGRPAGRPARGGFTYAAGNGGTSARGRTR